MAECQLNFSTTWRRVYLYFRKRQLSIYEIALQLQKFSY